MRKILLSITILFLFGFSLYAELNPDNYFLSGFTPIKNGKYVDKFRGFNSLEKNFFYKNNFTTKAELDSDDLDVSYVYSISGIPLSQPSYSSFDDYLKNTYHLKSRELFKQMTKDIQSTAGRDQGRGLLTMEFDPKKYNLPKLVKRIMGDRKSRLSLTGSQKITISGSLKETKGQAYGDNSVDFTPKMKQDLKLNLQGTIGEKILVKMTHHSATDLTLDDPNKIEISYKGDEDEIIQSIEAGDISLSLSGSKYISTSASSSGLFGVKTKMKMGNLEITSIISKEEGQKSSKSYSGQSDSTATRINIYRYEKRKYFYVVDPRELFLLAGEPGFDSQSEPKPEPEWEDNAIALDEDGKWIVKNPDLLPDKDVNGGLRVYLNDGDSSTDNLEIDGQEIGTGELRKYTELFANTDFSFNYDSGVLILLRQITTTSTLGIAYTNKAGEAIGNPSLEENGYVELKIICRDKSNETDTSDYEMKNVYSIDKGIQSEGFKIKIYTEEANGEENLNIADVEGASVSEYVDYLRLRKGSDYVNTSPTVNLQEGLLIFPFLKPFLPFGAEEIYDNPSQTSIDPDIKIEVSGKRSRETINLNSMNIIKGSVVVKLDGVTLKEDADYLVDYDFGNVTMLKAEAKEPTAKIDITYEYKPIFSIDSRSLFGMRADYKFSDEIQMGSTIVYQTETTADKRPKIGNANIALFMADIDGRLSFNPPFMTRMV
ncbi:MAG: hypothetical protein PHR06_14185, partial [Candidatus Cloacimonetes bacterium]|nr:hypothetical protein [Candidatus Cloacimonadota bacterium]